MSVAYYSEIPNITREQVEHVTGFMSERIPEGGPDGAVFHADGPTDTGGWWAIDVYASDEHFTRFHAEILTPAFAHADLDAPSYRRLEVAWDSTQMPT